MILFNLKVPLWIPAGVLACYAINIRCSKSNKRVALSCCPVVKQTPTRINTPQEVKPTNQDISNCKIKKGFTVKVTKGSYFALQINLGWRIYVPFEACKSDNSRVNLYIYWFLLKFSSLQDILDILACLARYKIYFNS